MQQPKSLLEFQLPFKVLLKAAGRGTAYTSKHAHYTQTHTLHTDTHTQRRACECAGGDRPPASLLIPAQHTCPSGGEPCVTCWPYRKLTYEDYPQTQLQQVSPSPRSFMCVTHSFIHLGTGFSSRLLSPSSSSSRLLLRIEAIPNSAPPPPNSSWGAAQNRRRCISPPKSDPARFPRLHPQRHY